MIPAIWNEETYQEFIDYLKSISEIKYKEFNSKIVMTKYKILGIRIPVLRKIAKKISKTDICTFISLVKYFYYEEVMIVGLVISNINDEKLFYKYFKDFIKRIDDWSICDTFCNSIKIILNYENKYYKEALKLALNRNEFIARVGLVVILNYFVKEEYLKEIFDVLNNINSNKYYINMAEAWLLCEICIVYREEGLKYLKANNLNDFTHNKAISKIRDSYRVSKEFKDCLNTLKRK